MKNSKQNQTEVLQFSNLQSAFKSQPTFFIGSDNPQEYELTPNFDDPSETRDFKNNADAILSSESKIFYIQNSSFSNNFYRQKDIVKPENKPNALIPLKRTIMIGEFVEGIELIESIEKSLNMIFEKKSNYSNWPDNQKDFATLYLVCDSLLEFKNQIFQDFWDYLSFKLQKFITTLKLKNSFFNIVITFNPQQVHNDGLLMNVQKSQEEINEYSRVVLYEPNKISEKIAFDTCLEEELLEKISKNVIIHPYFLMP